MDPNLMSGMADFMKNPEMMKAAMDMLKNNPGMMEQMMNMGKSPSNNLEDTEYNYDDKVIISGLKNDTYNNKSGVIRKYNIETSRYDIFISELDKSVSIKESNFIRDLVSTDQDKTEESTEKSNEEQNVESTEESTVETNE
jgi:hypothetical protein